jgi:hypothetical protein
MGVMLVKEEREVVRALRNTGMPLPVATLAVVLFTRGHLRPEKELIDIIGQYPNLEHTDVAENALTILKEMGWLTKTDSFDQSIVLAVSDLGEKMAERIKNQSLIDSLLLMRSQSTLASNVKLLGPMNTEQMYGSFRDLLQEAQREICLPMLATSPHSSVVEIIQERARKGAHVRILLASTEVAIKLRGETVAAKSQEAIKGWIKHAQNIPQMEIRIVHRPEDMYFATSWTLDEHLLRFDIYDPLMQRSLEGIMIEVVSPPGFHLNLITMFQACFNAAWNRAEPIHTFGKVRWWLVSNWQWWAFGVTAFIALLLGGTSVWGGIVGSVSATFLFNALVASWPRIRSAVRKILSD